MEPNTNKDEALRAKTVAEKKYRSNDITGARKLALRAQTLCPDLDGISQMITALDVLLASQVVVNGERDWYSVLSVCASADEDVVKRQYRKLALALHPDKNKSVGAEAAFKLVSEAWSTLSDRSRRMTYDQKRGGGAVHMSYQNGNAPSNGFCHFPGSTTSTSNVRANKSSSRAHSSVSPMCYPPPRPDTFWTSCSRCRMQYEYLRIYLNHNLLCPNCHGPFFASETGYPVNGYAPPAPSNHSSSGQFHNPSVMGNSHQHKRSTASVSARGSGGLRHRADFAFNATQEFSSASGSFKTYDTEQAENVTHRTYGKRANCDPCDGSHATGASHPDEPKKKQRRLNEDGRGYNNRHNNVADFKDKQTNYSTVLKTENGNCAPLDSGKAKILERQNSFTSRDLSSFDVRNLLMKKAKLFIRKTLEEWKLALAAKTLEKAQKNRKQKEKIVVTSNNDKIPAGKDLHQTTMPGNSVNETDEKVDSETPLADSSMESQNSVSIDVPDPDFHDFDKDRSETCFQADQIWAVYDDEDGMPRFYALVQKVICSDPFRIRMSYLKTKTNIEFSSLNWVSRGFVKTSGDFRVGRYETKDTINIFSHKVRWDKGARGIIRIFPNKGEIWALYRHWSPEWNEHTPDDVIHKYDMVEILDDYNEEQGISVIPLVKVIGFRTVFCRHDDPNEVKRVPREEMFRFSHQVPSFLLTGSEGQQVPKGCLELDPAATPLEFLQKVTENGEAKFVEASVQHSHS